MIDSYGRHITYLRVSVTDRCDLRCVYCMGEIMDFRPRADLLTLEELERLCRAFVRRGVRKIRLTGGEPLVRRNVGSLVAGLGQLVKDGALDELTLTTNATQLARHADALVAAGVRRINVSLDSLDPKRFAAITRRGRLEVVLDGIMAAKAAGLAIKVNTVALRETIKAELDHLVEWCGRHGFDLCLIETMPMGDPPPEYAGQYIPLSQVRERLDRRWSLADSDWRTGGPARYAEVAETGRRVGFITPLSHNFCESCNRVRVTCTGTLHSCLGRDNEVDLRTPLRASAADHLLDAAIDEAVRTKPQGHDFEIGRPASAGRPMSVTGG